MYYSGQGLSGQTPPAPSGRCPGRGALPRPPPPRRPPAGPPPGRHRSPSSWAPPSSTAAGRHRAPACSSASRPGCAVRPLRHWGTPNGSVDSGPPTPSSPGSTHQGQHGFSKSGTDEQKNIKFMICCTTYCWSGNKTCLVAVNQIIIFI